MDELADSAPLANDAGELCRRLADDGYLFFRGLLPADAVRAAGQAVLTRLRAGGWVDERGIPSIQPRAVNSMDALADPAFRSAVMSAAFNRIPYLPGLRAVVRRVLGLTAFSYPVKVHHHHDHRDPGQQDQPGNQEPDPDPEPGQGKSEVTTVKPVAASRARGRRRQRLAATRLPIQPASRYARCRGGEDPGGQRGNLKRQAC